MPIEHEDKARARPEYWRLAIRCYLVDWNRFVSQYIADGELRTALEGSIEVRPGDFRSNWTQDWLLKGAEAIRDTCPGASADALVDLFRHLFWSFCSRSYRIVELSPNAPDNLETAWGVETTRRFADLAASIRLEEFRPFFDEPNPHKYRTGYDRDLDFFTDASMWMDAVKEAGTSGRGFVVALLKD